jgi:hypothetical protein
MRPARTRLRRRGLREATMSALLYGYMVRQRRTKAKLAALESASPEVAQENKLATSVAALFPADVLTVHAFILSKATTTDADGNTTITNAALLRESLLWLLLGTIVVYVIGRGLSKWSPTDVVRLLIPPIAFVVWAAVLGTTTSLTPWVTGLTAPVGPLPKDVFVLIAAVAALILLAMSAAVNPPQEA